MSELVIFRSTFGVGKIVYDRFDQDRYVLLLSLRRFRYLGLHLRSRGCKCTPHHISHVCDAVEFI